MQTVPSFSNLIIELNVPTVFHTGFYRESLADLELLILVLRTQRIGPQSNESCVNGGVCTCPISHDFSCSRTQERLTSHVSSQS